MNLISLALCPHYCSTLIHTMMAFTFLVNVLPLLAWYLGFLD